jgi:hypothetical protein
MNRTRRILSIVIAAGTMLAIAAPNLRAESAIPDPATFFAGLVNPRAQGKKVSGFLTIAYVLVESGDPVACPSVIVDNMYVVTTMRYRQVVKPFNRNFIDAGGNRVVLPFCFDDLQSQIDFVLGLFKEEVIPFFFQCVPGVNCPAFQVKSMKNFLSSGTGAVSTEVRLAVAVPGAPGDDDD